MNRFFALLMLSLVSCRNATIAEEQSALPIMESAVDYRLVYPDLAWLVGLTADEVIARLGAPTVNNKALSEQLLDYQSASCDFSIFLRPSRSGERRVTWFLPTNKTGATVELRPCLATIFSHDRIDAMLGQQP